MRSVLHVVKQALVWIGSPPSMETVGLAVPAAAAAAAVAPLAVPAVPAAPLAQVAAGWWGG